ncbi:unannotated protein [freshwater metagenome]|uniref:Unannotated protein n=1 Tax=freshwater metagenome TaxID=449393 RepID=A0A6J7FVS2_9ZZZZ|nr:TIGR03862 family flavoprotein [Actinomycetota bacterium]
MGSLEPDSETETGTGTETETETETETRTGTKTGTGTGSGTGTRTGTGTGSGTRAGTRAGTDNDGDNNNNSDSDNDGDSDSDSDSDSDNDNISDINNNIVVIGGGPAGLIAAEIAATAGRKVTLIEHMPSVGRKLLLAGRGGLNLTHSEPFDTFVTRYGAAAPALSGALHGFDPSALRAWCAGLGERTFVGTSGRVFPQSLRATPLLRAWLRRLDQLGVKTLVRHEWQGWNDDGSLMVHGPHGTRSLRPAATVLALGGASWPRTGSTAAWVPVLRGIDVEVTALQPANCGFVVAWSPEFAGRFAGVPLKNVRLSFAQHSTRGEAMITAGGIEGGAIYAIGAPLREAIAADGFADVIIDLHPDLSPAQLAERFARTRPSDSTSTRLRRVGLTPAAVALMRETGCAPDALKALRLRLVGSQPIDRAISTAGGIAWSEIDEQLMLRRRPGVFVAGEMLDWEAPTGGYLLQACFSTGVAAARGALMLER